VSRAHDWPERLNRLAHILHNASIPRAAATTDAVDVHLRSVPFDRIRQLTAEIDRGAEHDVDELDRVAMRLLLEEYVSAVAHLRAVSRIASQRVDSAPGPLKELRMYVHRQTKLRERAQRRAESADVSDGQAPAGGQRSESR
jgi:hypothetical protein